MQGDIENTSTIKSAKDEQSKYYARQKTVVSHRARAHDISYDMRILREDIVSTLYKPPPEFQRILKTAPPKRAARMSPY